MGIPFKKGVAFTFTIPGLGDQSDSHAFKVNPTIAEGDFKRLFDGAGSFVNMTNTPTVPDASGPAVVLSFSESEANHDEITVWAHDAVGSEWDDLGLTFVTDAKQIGELGTSNEIGALNDLSSAEAAVAVWSYVIRTLTGYVVTGVDEATLGVAENLADFYPGETVSFSITCTIDGVAQDITNDTVKLYMKRKRTDSDANAVLTKTADVATQGASGIALFTINPADTTNVDPQTYVMDIVWTLAGGGEYVIHDQNITILERVSDA